MSDNTIPNGIQTMITQALNEIPKPQKVLITKTYSDGHVDVKTLNEEEIEYVLAIGTATVNKYGILFSIENDELIVIV